MTDATQPTDSERTWAILVHGSALIGGLSGGIPAFVGPLVIYLIYRDRSPYIAHHAREALNFSISFLIYAVVSAALIIILVGLFLLPAVGIAFLVLSILAMVAASRNEWYRYPLTLRFIGR